jgi:DNA-binding NarL/FixJ family response regulator
MGKTPRYHYHYRAEINKIVSDAIKKSQVECVDYNPLELSPAEITICLLLCRGWSVKEVALRLKVSTNTVNCHKAHIYNKLQARSIVDVVKYSLQHLGASL